MKIFFKLYMAEYSKSPLSDGYYKYYYYNHEKLIHRSFDLPAIIWRNGSKEWFYKGFLHRLIGPAQNLSNFNQKRRYYFGGFQSKESGCGKDELYYNPCGEIRTVLVASSI